MAQETRHWDADANATTTLRTKEYAYDYRYFPEPDLVPLALDRAFVEEVKAGLPELPSERRKRFRDAYGLPEHDAALLTSSKSVGDFYEAAVGEGVDPKAVSNWMMGELSAFLNARNLEIEQIPTTPVQLAGMIAMVEKGLISGKIAKPVFEEMLNTGDDPGAIVERQGMTQISDEEELAGVISGVIAENPGSVEDYRGGKGKALGFLVGQVMRKTKGRANPQLVNEMLRRSLEE